MPAGAYEFLYVILLAVIVGIIAYLIYRLTRKRNAAAYLESLWGIDPDRTFSANEIEAIKNGATYLNGSSLFEIDDITWNDLEMDKVYKATNHTLTMAGDEMLYLVLKRPVKSEHGANAETIRRMSAEPSERSRVRHALYRCGRLVGVDLKMLKDDSPYKASSLIASVIMSVGLLASIVLLSAGITFAAPALLALTFTNVIYSTIMHMRHTNFINTLSYIISINKCAFSIWGKDGLFGLLKKTEAVRKSSALSLFYSDDSILLLLNRLFLLETISIYHLLKKINVLSAELVEVYRNVGNIDAMQAAASFKHMIGGTEPVFTDAMRLDFEDAVHPLLKSPVPNSLSLSSSALVTGSNATGKSTFLKMIALNAILAQSINTVSAKSWQSPFFSIYTSMAVRDSIDEGDSYFVTEIKALRRMVQSGDTPALFIVDEVLRGTNTAERIAASAELLLGISDDRICIAATHDTELTFILEGKYRNLHFTETIKEGAMSFDYKLREGRSDSRNAIKLLGLMGFDEGLVKRAEKRFDRFTKTGEWTD